MNISRSLFIIPLPPIMPNMFPEDKPEKRKTNTQQYNKCFIWPAHNVIIITLFLVITKGRNLQGCVL